ncbi:hypothetical protein [Novosphingobium huizhouense]|uniref:hypothetical protein n=1 Tax=Novosphingobium huizhouense TaxID=2866625 RepID=UPI001CD8CE99|nr:hypothetical protein [Novosphingobium huizhouense]
MPDDTASNAPLDSSSTAATDDLTRLQQALDQQTAQADTAKKSVDLATTALAEHQTRDEQWQAQAPYIASAILLYGLAITGISVWLVNRGRDSDEVLRLVAVLSAVILAAFLLVAGYDDKQMTPVMGLLGTIVGYLLGKEQGVRQGVRQGAGTAQGEGAPADANAAVAGGGAA